MMNFYMFIQCIVACTCGLCPELQANPVVQRIHLLAMYIVHLSPDELQELTRFLQDFRSHYVEFRAGFFTRLQVEELARTEAITSYIRENPNDTALHARAQLQAEELDLYLNQARKAGPLFASFEHVMQVYATSQHSN